MLVPDYSPDYRKRCLEVVDAALGEIPIYEKWAAFDGGGDDAVARLSAFPLVDKTHMRKHGPARFMAPKADLSAALARGEVEIVHTSGSTGDRVSNVWCQAWWNASEEASWRLNAYARLVCDGVHPEAILASPLCVGFPCEEGYLARRQRTLGRFLFLNERVDPCGWTPEHMTRMVEEINDFQPVILEGSPSYLGHLCRFAAKKKLRIHSPKLIVLTFENASVLHRRQIESVFDSPLASSYGATEAGYVFMECECGRLHQNTAFCHVDFIPFSSSQGGPEIGSILVTTFRNPWRALLRFDIGDIVRLAKEPCPCGRREGLTLAGIEGRAVNLTVTPEGCAVTQDEVDRAVGGLPGIDEYQLVQVAERGYCLKFICQAADERSIAARLRSVLAALYGKNAQIYLERVASIAPDPPGKYRLTKPLISLNPRAFWDPRHVPPPNPADVAGEGGASAS